MKAQIIEIEGKFYKECGVVMLPTEKCIVGTIMKYIEKMDFHDNEIDVHVGGLILNKNYNVTSKTLYHQPQHLYITSDDEIKEGDWFYDIRYNSIFQSENDSDKDVSKYFKKIIATTNLSLIVVNKINHGKEGGKEVQCILPQPSDKFIQAYIEAHNKGEKIEKVLVEYDMDKENGFKQYKGRVLYFDNTSPNKNYNKPKLKDNNIIIKKVKDSWTREETISLCKKAAEYGYENELDNEGQLTDEWFKENL